MGRFYKTAKPEMMDFMFKVPEQAIMTAIKGADAQLEGQEAYLTDLQKQLKTAALEEDEEKRKARVTELEGKIREHSLKLFENPLLAIKEQKGIRDLGQEIYKDLTEGELYAYNTNYATRQKYYEKAVEDATGKDGRLNVDQVKNAMAAFDAQYKMKEGAKFNKETGKFNPYGTELLYDYVDKSKYAADVANGWESTKYEELKSSQNGSYWWDIGKKTDVLELDELTLGIYNIMSTDPTVMQQVMQDIQLKAQAKAAQEARLTGGNYEELEEKYFNQFRDEEFGVYDPATKQLALEEVLDEKGQPKINEQTKKPIMKFVNPGNLYRIAQAAADKKNKNDIGTTEKMTGADEFAKIDYTKKKELENARALEADKQASHFDRLTGQYIETTFEGTTLEEAEAGLDKQLNGLSTSVLDYKNNLFKVLTAGKNLNTKQIEAINLKFKELFPESDGANMKPKFNELETYLASLGFEGDPNITGVKEYKEQWESAFNNYENKKELLRTMKDQTKENLPDIDKFTYKALELVEKQARDELSSLEDDLRNNNLGPYGNSEAQLKKLIAEQESKIKDARKDKKSIISKNLNLNPEDNSKNADGTNKNRNTVSFATYQTAGDLLADLGVDSTKVSAVRKVLNDAKKDDFFALFGGASGAGTFVRNQKGTAMEPLKGTTLGEYFTQQDKFTRAYNEETGELVIKSVASGSTVFQGNVGNYYIAIDDLDRLGTNSIATTISGTQLVNGKSVPVTFDLYTNQLTSSATKAALGDVKDELALLAFERDAKKTIQQANSPTFKFRNKSGRVLYSKSPDGQGIFEFYDDAGIRQGEAIGSKAALAYWKVFK